MTTVNTLDTEIIPVFKIEQMVDLYTRSQAEIKEHYRRLFEISKELTQVFGNERYQLTSFSTMPDRYNHYNIPETVALNIRKAAWKCVVARLDIEKIMSLKAQEDLHRRLDGKDQFGNEVPVPELSTQAVLDIFQAMSENAGEYFKQMVMEVYTLLMPGQLESNEHVTNKKYARNAMGKKIILARWLRDWYPINQISQLSIRSGRENELVAIDRVFHSLDGKKNIPEGYHSPLVDQMETQVHAGIDHGETEFFTWKVYLNGNIHLGFKRLDLVRMFNQIAGAGNRIGDGE